MWLLQGCSWGKRAHVRATHLAWLVSSWRMEAATHVGTAGCVQVFYVLLE